MTSKEILRESEAKRTIIKARKAFFELLGRGGIILEEGYPDARGKPFTTASIDELRRRVDDALWQSLEDGYVIKKDMPDDKAGSTA